MRLRRWLFALCLLAAGLYPVAGAATPACAADTAHAALVVDKGAEVLRYCVEFPAGQTSVTGIELIELAGQQHGLSYRFDSFAGVGLAVCMLDGLEPPDGDRGGVPNVDAAEDLDREGEFVDKDVNPAGPEFEREGDFTDKDVTAADTDTEPRSFVAKDVPD